MQEKGWFDGLLESVKDDPKYRLEKLMLEITEKICTRMEELGMNRKGLAEKIGISSPGITKILRGSSNFKLKTLLTIADALESEIKVDFVAKEKVLKNKLIPLQHGERASSASKAVMKI
jgi:transcriptional regulator with XRE-family HTH domain